MIDPIPDLLIGKNKDLELLDRRWRVWFVVVQNYLKSDKIYCLFIEVPVNFSCGSMSEIKIVCIFI
ncbi:hypothetical protein DPV73_08500 [Leptospira mayottensis]|nr:hypothetical protein DPV73_08500 [Leptospira mayottensis]